MRARAGFATPFLFDSAGRYRLPPLYINFSYGHFNIRHALIYDTTHCSGRARRRPFHAGLNDAYEAERH